MTFTLDTSGHFHIMPGHPLHHFMGVNRIEWPDLTPFAQGFVEALFRSLCKGFERAGFFAPYEHQGAEGVTRTKAVGFSDLAPEALALILKDCEAAKETYPAGMVLTAEVGRAFWGERQGQPRKAFIAKRAGGYHVANFPPLTSYLNDEGQVCLKATR